MTGGDDFVVYAASVASLHPVMDLQHWTDPVFKYMPPCCQETMTITSVLPMAATTFPFCPQGRRLQPNITRLPLGSLALRPALLLGGNLRPLVTKTPLPHATESYGQLLGRDFNPLDLLLLLRTDRFNFTHAFGSPALGSGAKGDRFNFTHAFGSPALGSSVIGNVPPNRAAAQGSAARGKQGTYHGHRDRHPMGLTGLRAICLGAAYRHAVFVTAAIMARGAER